MKAKIIVYSQTGHTLSVAEKLKEQLLGEGHEVVLEQIKADLDKNKMPSVLTFKPETGDADLLYLASPVHAFSLCAAMKKYLEQLPDLKGKKVACFVTQHFPFAWMGGNRAVKTMKKLLEQKGAAALETSVVNWSSKNREQMIEDTVNKLKKI